MMCGNTLILKPSSHTPGATQLQAELWKAAGLPDGVFNVVYGGREAVVAIVEHPLVKAIQFVGSTAVGRYVYEEGGKRGKRVGAYTSAKNAMLVLPDADMDLAADAAVASGYGSAGERCMAQTLLIAVGDTARAHPAQDPRADRQAQDRQRHGARRRHGPDLLARAPRERHRLDRQGRGGGCRAGGRWSDIHQSGAPDGFFLGVTLFDNVKPDMEIFNEEIFGPVLGVVRVATYDEALALINGHKYANGTAIFTTDGGAARRFKLEVDVPMIGVNVPIPVPAGYLSFGGSKLSAFGDLAMRGEDGVRFFTQQKMVTERWPRAGQAGPLSLVFPGNS